MAHIDLGFAKLGVPCWGGRNSKDQCVLGFILGPHILVNPICMRISIYIYIYTYIYLLIVASLRRLLNRGLCQRNPAGIHDGADWR